MKQETPAPSVEESQDSGRRQRGVEIVIAQYIQDLARAA